MGVHEGVEKEAKVGDENKQTRKPNRKKEGKAQTECGCRTMETLREYSEKHSNKNRFLRMLNDGLLLMLHPLYSICSGRVHPPHRSDNGIVRHTKAALEYQHQRNLPALRCEINCFC